MCSDKRFSDHIFLNKTLRVTSFYVDFHLSMSKNVVLSISEQLREEFCQTVSFGNLLRDLICIWYCLLVSVTHLSEFAHWRME